MYREKYCQRRAIEMYASGRSKDEVIAMLVEENAREADLIILADKFYADYQFLRKEKRKQKLKNAEFQVILGSVLLAGGFLLTLMSYLTIGTEQYVLFTGLVISGLIFLTKGVIEKSQLSKDIHPKTTHQ